MRFHRRIGPAGAQERPRSSGRVARSPGLARAAGPL